MGKTEPMQRPLTGRGKDEEKSNAGVKTGAEQGKKKDFQKRDVLGNRGVVPG